jgi:hypothetical protein
MPDLKQVLKEYVATANSPKYNNDFAVINSKFPELKGYDPKVLQEYVATANSEKYNNDFDVINSKFPEFFKSSPEKKSSNAPTASSGMGVLLAGKGKAQKSVSEQIISELPKTTTTTKVKEPEEDGKYWERTKSTLSTLGKSVVDGIFATSAKQIAIVSKTIDDEVREMVGMKPLSKPIEEYQTYQWGKSIESATDKTFQPNPEFKGELQEQVAQTAGDLLGLVATAIITKNPSSALAKLGTTGIVKQLANSATRKAITREIAKESVKMLAKPTTFVAAAQTGTRNYDEAKSKGATDDQANAMFWSTALTGGIINNLPVGSLLSRFDKATGGRMKDMVVGGVVGGIEEAVTESIEQISTNFAAKNIYDETRTLFEGVEESAAMGGGFGFVLNAMGVKLGSLRNKYKGNPEKIAEIDQSIDYIKDIAEKEGQGSAIKLSKEEKNQVDRYSEIINNPQSTPEEIDIANEKIQEITGQKIIDAENTTQLISGLSEDAQIDLKLIDSEIDRLRDAAEKSRNVEIKDRLESDILNLQNKKNTIINSVSQETTQKPSVSGRIIEPDKPITEMDSEELYDYAIKYKKALQAQDKEFLNKTEAEKEAGGYYDIIDEVESLRDTSEKMNFIENSENVSELADSLKSIFNKIRSSGPDEYQTSLINAAKKKSQELGIGTEDLIKTISKKISKDYNDATDAELMVKDFLGKVSGTKSPNDTIKNPAPSVLPNIPASTKPVTLQDQVDQLRADEQAEYDAMSDPNNEAARKKIYDKYDEKITPLLKEIVESTAKELKATDQDLLIAAMIESGEITYTDEKGNPCAAFGFKGPKFKKGGTWNLIKEFKGKSHSNGGIDIEIGKGSIRMSNKQSKFEAKYGLVIAANGLVLNNDPQKRGNVDLLTNWDL